jgi:hypothetical protein
MLCESDVAIYNVGFGGGCHATQSETKASRTLVHGACLGKTRIFGMLNDWQIQLRPEAQGLAHNFIVKNWLSVIRDGHCTGTLQRLKIGERPAL